ncbi:hypothetical protein [Methyloglobulus morosus]|uniref:hypothetical protein n=1 Tax=Methyloglobulus morosus TaxID=1410681 RepID=UPI001F3E02B4|nr:hypothetical protein [Methyloglobulus morosus]
MNRITIKPLFEASCWIALFTVFVCPSQAAQESQQVNKLPSVSSTHYQAGQTTISEGRTSVDFYHRPTGTALNDKASLLLSDKVVPYPATTVERPRPLLELGDPFLGNGTIQPGVKTPTSQMLQPWFLIFGTFRSAVQSYDNGDRNTVEWANRLDLNGNLNLSGTERVFFYMRPLDGQAGGYSGYNFEPNNTDGWQDDFNARLTKLYFEGELGEIFPGLDPTDSHAYDVGFSIGRQRLQLQDGMLMNDIVDMIGITRNSLVFDGISNLRITGLYGWNNVNRGNNALVNNNHEHSVNLFGFEAEADTALNNTLSLDLLYVDDDHDKNAWYVGAASTQRFSWLNSTFRINASIPEGNGSQTVGSGVLLLSQLSNTLSSTDNIVYFNTFLDIDRFTSAARSPDQGSPVANLGILYAPIGMGRYGMPLGRPIDDTIGTAIGYQMFLDGIDSQLIFEIGGRTSTQSNRDESGIGVGARYQHTFGTHHVLRLDSFVAGQENQDIAYGLRTEWMVKF